MKKNAILLILIIFGFSVVAQTTDYLSKKEYQSEKRKISESINALKKQVARQRTSLDSLSQLAAKYESLSKASADSFHSLSARVSTIQIDLDSDRSRIGSSRFILLTSIGILLLLICISFFWLHRKSAKMLEESEEKIMQVKEQIMREINEVKLTMTSQQEGMIKTTGELSSRMSATVYEFSQKAVQLSEVQKSETDKLVKSIATLQQSHNSMSVEAENNRQVYWDELKRLKDALHLLSARIEENIQETANRISALSTDIKALKGK